MSDDTELFQGKWKDLDEKAAIYARDCLQSIVDSSLPTDGEVEIGTLQTVILTARLPNGATVSRLRTDLAQDELDQVYRACTEPTDNKFKPPIFADDARNAEVRKLAEDAQTMLDEAVTGWVSQLQHPLMGYFSEEFGKLVEKYEKQYGDLSVLSDDDRLDALRELLDDTKRLLALTDIKLVVDGRDFRVAGFSNRI